MHSAVIIGLIVVFGTTGEPSSADSQPTQARSDAAAKLTVPKPQLQHVALLFRHTVRAPRVFPPNDSLLRPEFFPRGGERSTREGLIATRNATLVWREWYKDFLKGEIASEPHVDSIGSRIRLDVILVIYLYLHMVKRLSKSVPTELFPDLQVIRMRCTPEVLRPTDAMKRWPWS